MIDTGFTGFLMMPITQAFPLGLTLIGTANYALVDGTITSKLPVFGHVRLEDELLRGVIVPESKPFRSEIDPRFESACCRVSVGANRQQNPREQSRGRE